MDVMNCGPPGAEWRLVDGGRVATCCDRGGAARVGYVASGRLTRSAQRGHGEGFEVGLRAASPTGEYGK